jgi:hypothetical protein
MINLRSITLLCTIGISLIIVVSILGIAHLSANSNLSADQNNVRASLQSGNSPTGSFKILNHQMTKPILSKEVVKGQVKNEGPDKLCYATINVYFYKNKNLVYSGTINLSNIAPGEIRDFEVPYRGPDNSPDSYDVAIGSYL